MVRLALLYRAEYWPVKNSHIQKMHMAEIKILRWMCEHIRTNRIRNKDIRDKVGVASVVNKMMEERLRWFEYVKKRRVNAPERRCDRLDTVR